MATAIGIDLGTTNSVVAMMDATGRAKAFPNESGKTITPSVVLFDGDAVIVGEKAKDMQRIGEKSVASFFKRLMGDPQFRFVCGDCEFSAIELSACVLRSLKADAERALGTPVTDAVITVPAYFHEPERKATIEAGRLAGLNVLQLINEPTAAAVAYGVTKPAHGERRVLVYDLGGGTFDVTLLNFGPKAVQVLTSEGDAELGGKDWDGRIVEFLAGEFSNEYGTSPLDDSTAIGELWIAAEDAKRALTDRSTTSVSITHNGEVGRYKLSRDQFEELCDGLVERTMETVRTVLDRTHTQKSAVNEVLLVGGSTRMPMIRKALEQFFGFPPSHGVNVDEVVGLGAAICAHIHITSTEPTGLASLQPGQTIGTGLMLPGGSRLIDVTPDFLGMIAVNRDNTAYINSIILQKDQPVPRREFRPYQHHTRPNNDNPLEIFMTQGKREEPDQVIYLGRYVIRQVPHDPSGTAVVNVDYAYDLSGSVHVQARLASDNSELPVLIEPLPEDVPQRFLVPPPKPVIAHVTVYLAFDLSGSMSGQPLAEAQKAAAAFLHQIDLSHCSVGVVAVADRTETVLRASQNASHIEQAINRLTIGMVGYGNAAHPFDEAMGLLNDVAGPRFFITLADGVWSDQPRAVRSAKALHQACIDVIAIGFGGADQAFLKEIASCDQGSFFTSLNGLGTTFSSIAQVITQTQGGLSGQTHSGSKPKSRFWGLLKKDSQ